MDFQRFGIDLRLAKAAQGLKIDFFFYEKLLAHAVESQENVCAKIALSEGREEVLLLPVLQWLLSGESRRALVVVPDASSGDRCALAIARLGGEADIETCRVGRASLSEGGPESPVFEGDPSSSIVIGRLSDLIVACPPLNLKDYGFVFVDGADRVAELPSESVHKFIGALLPSWERRSLLSCSKISAKAKNLARDLADNPVEISIDGEVAKAQSVVKETWNMPGEAKLRFLLGLQDRENPESLCIFCNLKDTAEEVSRRLQANGRDSDYIVGALAIDRKLAILAKVKSGKRPCLVLTDLGAEGLPVGAFPLVVNFDIPLEPEFFVKRIEMLDREDPGAKVVSLACDRYIYGLPAVESYIDAKLDAVAADESLLSAVDKSEGMNFDKAQRGDEGRSANRNQSRRGDSRRDSNRFRDLPREDRSPDIRKSISEATGGSLEMGEARRQMPPRGPGDRDGRGAPKPAAPRGPEGRRGPASPRGDGRRGERSKKPAQRAQAPKQSFQRPPANSGPARQGPPPVKNPYDMPIEERMKQYREKYGRSLGSKRQDSPQRGGQSRPPAKGNLPRGGSASGSTPGRQGPGDPPKGGFFGKLFGGRKKRDEQ